MSTATPVDKAPTGIQGFDDMTRGGLPRGCATLIGGGPASGKTVFSLQTLVGGARDHSEPGIFVAFEESARRILANADSFGWNIAELQGDRLFFLDARPRPDLIRSGSFDLAGMLAALDAKVAEMGARRIVFDAIDVVLDMLPDPIAARHEVYRLHDWLLQRNLTALITAKAGIGWQGHREPGPYGYMQFMVDCAVLLGHDVVQGASQRDVRILKYRGSAFEENATPLLIGPRGIEVAFSRGHDHVTLPVTAERVSSGIARLDEMLDGGYFRGASVLLTGAPGTAKTTLAGSFAEAACLRGEHTLFVSFDSRTDEIVRNLASVGIRLGRFVESGLLRMSSMRAISGSAEAHLMRIRYLAREHGAACVVIDPISALSKSGEAEMAQGVAERLIDWAKADGGTLLCTSLLDDDAQLAEGTPLRISTIADTWIHLSYLVHAGERNRGLSIVKSRGSAHSNQVRELLLRHDGVDLTDVYTAGGAVLMGTLRWERERAERKAAIERATEARRRRTKLRMEEIELTTRLELLRQELELKQVEQENLSTDEAVDAEERDRITTGLRRQRMAETFRPSGRSDE